MDLFRVLTPNNLLLSKEVIREYLIGDSDPFMCRLDHSNDENYKNISNIVVTKLPLISDECAISQQTSQTELITVQECTLSPESSLSDGETKPDINLKGADNPDIYQWLRENFEMLADHCIARGDLYAVFCNCCEQKGLTPCNQALFGKAVRSVFPDITTRRIGIRNQSRYHYTGIRPKRSSKVGQLLSVIKKKSSLTLPNLKAALLSGYPDSQELATGSCDRRQMNIRSEGLEHHLNLPTDHLITTLLPHFPDIDSVNVQSEFHDQTVTLLSLYRFLALDILSAVIKTQFSKIHEMISVFWRNVPYDVYHCLGQSSVIAVVLACDRLIHGAMINLLAPNILVIMPASMIGLLLQNFCQHYKQQAEQSLQACPQPLRSEKLKETMWFSRRLYLRLSLCSLCDQVRVILSSADEISHLHMYIKKVDMASVILCSRFASDETGNNTVIDRLKLGIQEFINLLDVHACFDQYIRWIKSAFKQHLNKNCFMKVRNTTEAARVVILEMNYLTGLIERELKVGKAPPRVQETFHMLMMFSVSFIRHLLEEEFGGKVLKTYI